MAESAGCEVCKKFWEQKNQEPPCATCDIPPILPGNALTLDVLDSLGGAFTDGMGGINLASILAALELLGIHGSEKLRQAQKLVSFIKTLAKENLRQDGNQQ